MALEVPRDRERIGARPLDPEVQGAQAPVQQPGLEGPRDRAAEVPLGLHARPERVLRRGDQDAREPPSLLDAGEDVPPVDGVYELVGQRGWAALLHPRVLPVLEAHPRELVVDALRHVLLSIAPSRRLPDDESQLGGLYRSVLRDRRMLLLFDNAGDERQVEPLLPPAGSTVLVTSRRRFMLPGLFVLRLAALAPADAAELYRTIVGERAQRADDVAKLCGCLPLAVRLAASELNLDLASSEASLLERLRDDAERARLVERAIDQSYARLRPEAQSCLRALTAFPDSFDGRAAGAVCASDDAPRALRELQQASLVDSDGRTGRYRLHDLVRAAVASRLDADERTADEHRFAGYFLGLWRELEERHQDSGVAPWETLAAFDRERANIDAAFAWTEERALREPRAAALCAASVGPAAALLQLRRTPRQLRRWFLVALRAARRVGDRDAELHSLGWLGDAWSLLGHYRKAVACQQRRLALAAGRRSLVGDALEGLARAHGYGSDYRTAAKLLEECLARAREDGDRARQARLAYRLAHCFERLQPARALDLYHEARRHARATGRQCLEGEAECGIGVHRVWAGADDEARAHFERGLAIARRYRDRDLELYALGCKASLCARRADHPAALQLLDQVERIARQLENTLQLSVTLRCQAASLEALGRRREAVARVREVLALGERASGHELTLARDMLARLDAAA